MLSVLTEGNRLYEGVKLKGVAGQINFNLVYESSMLEPLESDFDSRQYLHICAIQKQFKLRKIKESFTVTLARRDRLVEIYYLSSIRKLLIKVLEQENKLELPKESGRLYCITKKPTSEFNTPKSAMVISQMITLPFADIHHPVEPLTDQQLTKLMNLLVFKKLIIDVQFSVLPFTNADFKELISPSNIEHSFHMKTSLGDKMRSETNPRARHVAYSDLQSALEEKLHETNHHMQSPNVDSTTNVSLLPSLKWEFCMDQAELKNTLPLEDTHIRDPATPGGSSFHHGQLFPKITTSVGPEQILEESSDQQSEQPRKKLDYKTFIRHKLMKPKLFAVYTLNSLRGEKKRLTTPVLSHRTDEKDSGSQHAEQQKRINIKKSYPNSSEQGHEDNEDEAVALAERRSRQRLRTVLTTKPQDMFSVVSKNITNLPDLSTLKADYRIRDTTNMSGRESKRKSMGGLKRQLIIPGLNEDDGFERSSGVVEIAMDNSVHKSKKSRPLTASKHQTSSSDLSHQQKFDNNSPSKLIPDKSGPMVSPTSAVSGLPIGLFGHKPRKSSIVSEKILGAGLLKLQALPEDEHTPKEDLSHPGSSAISKKQLQRWDSGNIRKSQKPLEHSYGSTFHKRSNPKIIVRSALERRDSQRTLGSHIAAQSNHSTHRNQ